MNKKQFIDNQQSHIPKKNDHNAQFGITTKIQAFQRILKSPIPWISSKNYEMPSSAKRYLDESCSGIKLDSASELF